MPLIKKFKLFLESLDTAPQASSNVLEMTSVLFPLFGSQLRDCIDAEKFLDIEDEDIDHRAYWNNFPNESFEARILEEINAFIQNEKYEIKEHLTSLNIGIEDIKAVSIHSGRMGSLELYFDLVMDSEWKETITEYIESIRPVKLDAFLTDRFKSRAGYISTMPKNKHDLLKALNSEDDVERGIGSILQYLVTESAREEWGERLYAYLIERVHYAEFDRSDDDEEDDDDEDGIYGANAELGGLDEDDEEEHQPAQFSDDDYQRAAAAGTAQATDDEIEVGYDEINDDEDDAN